MDRREPGFTKFDNYFLDHVLPRVSGVEWKIISVIIRGTVGWQRPGGKHREEVELTNDRLQQLTGVASQALCAGIKKSLARGVVKRRPQQKGRQRTFCFSAIPRANLKSLELQLPSHQEPLPFVSDGDNHNANSADRIVKTTIATPLSDGDNHNANDLVLRSVKKSKDLNTHTGVDDPIVDGLCVCDDEFCFNNIRAHVDYAIARGDQVLNRAGLIKKIERERKAVDRMLIRESLTAIALRERLQREREVLCRAQEAADREELEEMRARLATKAG